MSTCFDLFLRIGKERLVWCNNIHSFIYVLIRGTKGITWHWVIWTSVLTSTFDLLHIGDLYKNDLFKVFWRWGICSILPSRSVNENDAVVKAITKSSAGRLEARDSPSFPCAGRSHRPAASARPRPGDPTPDSWVEALNLSNVCHVLLHSRKQTATHICRSSASRCSLQLGVMVPLMAYTCNVFVKMWKDVSFLHFTLTWWHHFILGETAGTNRVCY